MRTSRSNVPIAGLPSLSALRNKNNLHQEAIPTSLSAALRAARQGKHVSTETAATVMGMVATATDHHAKCSPRYAPSVAKTLKYPLNLPMVGQCIAAIATAKLEPVDNADLDNADLI